MFCQLHPGHVGAMQKWRNIRLELGRTAGFPSGSVSRGYLIRLPLDDGDRVDRKAMDEKPHWATVQRYWSTEPDEIGTVGRADQGLALHCDGRPARLVRIGDRPIRLGQQVFVIDPDGTELPFKVANIR